jgi:acetoin utilization protein AcuA
LNDIEPHTLRHATDKGEVLIRAFSTPAQIRSHEFDRQFGTHAQYKSIYTKRATLEKHAAVQGANVVLALAGDHGIVGFGVLNYPNPDERWHALGPKLMMEVKAIEVSRRWRSSGIAEAILTMLLDHPDIEKMIVYMVGYSWTWDLDGSGKTAQQYRQMMIRLFSPHGFVEYQTNEPNICLKPENLFMGRVGRDVSDEINKQFKWLRFGVSP